MDRENLALATGLIPKAYISQAEDALNARRKLIKSLLSQRCLPVQGWDEASIEYLLQEAAKMDSSNFLDNVGVGEREARVACPLVRRRHYNMAHGVGRSGDISAVQPKAAGSSLLAMITNFLALDALKLAGMADVSAASVLPLATGMTLTSVLLALKQRRPASARYVLWPRIDQKTCAKCVVAAGLELVVIPLLLQGDQLSTDIDCLVKRMTEIGSSQIVCVLSTTSCFAPRAADNIVEISKLCQKEDIGHVINNAYGVQAKQLCSLIASAWRKGRVDAVVQSTDKNFMVPVGGSIVAAGPGKADFVDAVNAAYPGRASASPMLDLLMTLLSWGREGWQGVLAASPSLGRLLSTGYQRLMGALQCLLVKDREELYTYCRMRLEDFASSHGLALLKTPGNPISLALSIESIARQIEGSTPSVLVPPLPITYLGSLLFTRCVSGTRVIGKGTEQKVAGVNFKGYGSHCDDYPFAYLTLAAAIGTSRTDVDTFLLRLENAIETFQKRLRRAS